MFDYRSLFDLTGRSALVVGAGSGIGQASALGLAAHGARVYCADINLAGAEETAAAIRTHDGEAETLFMDITDPESIAQGLEGIGAVDILVSTPSINVRKPLLDYTPEEFDRVIHLNLKGAFQVVQAVARGMAERGRGSIIVFSSIRSQVVEPGQGVYAATKAGVVQMMRALAAELAPKGVRVNLIGPGVVETPLTEQIKQHPEWYDAYAQRNAFGRWAQPHEMAGAVVYLASDASSYVTGTILFVDGGWLAIDGRFEPPLPSS
ncbi:MAG TPA: SDR family oxidoreductase [Caldilineae bacterium]|nr:SDR family oxidoreductase [Caldilineae bacterium]HIQ11569.1 SDR family oxidoreductase [Caldilineales bacterium]